MDLAAAANFLQSFIMSTVYLVHGILPWVSNLWTPPSSEVTGEVYQSLVPCGDIKELHISSSEGNFLSGSQQNYFQLDGIV